MHRGKAKEQPGEKSHTEAAKLFCNGIGQPDGGDAEEQRGNPKDDFALSKSPGPKDHQQTVKRRRRTYYDKVQQVRQDGGTAVSLLGRTAQSTPRRSTVMCRVQHLVIPEASADVREAENQPD